MRANLRVVLRSLLLLGSLFLDRGHALAFDPPSPAAESLKAPSELCKQAQELTEVVLRQHLDPPTRQQMILGGLRRLYQAAGLTIPAGLSRRVSLAVSPEQFESLIMDLWPVRPRINLSTQQLQEAFTEGLLGGVPGGAYLNSSKEQNVQEQLQGNRYVGIHIQLSYDEKAKRSVIQATVPGGPADRAGAKEGDQIEEVDGVDTKDMKIAQVVDRIRGPEGTEVVVKVRQPKARESRTLRMTRGVLFLPTVSEVRKTPSGEGDFRVGGADSPAYVRIRDISASTPHELRKLAQELEREGCKAVILDLRGLSSIALHPTVLLADSLLGHGRIGQVRMADRVMTYDATEDDLFRGWPMAVLVDSGTGDGGEWLAAALQDNHRAAIVGSLTRGGQATPHGMPSMTMPRPGEIRSNVPVADGRFFLSLVTGRFERGNGRPLAAPPTTKPNAAEEGRPGPTEGDEQAAGGGVKPDYPVSPRSPRAGSRVPARRGSVFTEDKPIEPASDPCLLKAVEVLRGAPKKA